MTREVILWCDKLRLRSLYVFAEAISMRTCFCFQKFDMKILLKVVWNTFSG